VKVEHYSGFQLTLLTSALFPINFVLKLDGYFQAAYIILSCHKYVILITNFNPRSRYSPFDLKACLEKYEAWTV